VFSSCYVTKKLSIVFVRFRAPLTHFDAEAEAHMVDVAGKADTTRHHGARPHRDVARHLRDFERHGAKGDVLRCGAYRYRVKKPATSSRCTTHWR
jgi:hypothetical protein